jgi:hypothetical protein
MKYLDLKQMVEEELLEALKYNTLKKVKKQGKFSDETPSEKRERIFPGSDDSRKLAVGITETEEEEEELEEKKEKKKNCSAGSPYHGKDGRFVNPDKEGGSWSVANKSNKTDCKKGKSRRPSGRQERFTKLPCGRKDVDNPNVKAKNLCKGNPKESKNWEDRYSLFLEGVDNSDALAASKEHIILPEDPYEQAKVQQKLEVIIKKLKKQLAKASKTKSTSCPLSVVDAMELINNLELSSKGKLKEPQGKGK